MNTGSFSADSAFSSTILLNLKLFGTTLYVVGSDPALFAGPDDFAWNLFSCLFTLLNLLRQILRYSSFGKIGKPVPFTARLSLVKRRDVPDRIAAVKRIR